MPFIGICNGLFLIILVMTALLYIIGSKAAFASEYDSSEKISRSSGIISTEESSSNSASNGNSVNNVVNQQNTCQGNVVICQNILTKLICSERAICIIGNLDPFLLVLPN